MLNKVIVIKDNTTCQSNNFKSIQDAVFEIIYKLYCVKNMI